VFPLILSFRGNFTTLTMSIGWSRLNHRRGWFWMYGRRSAQPRIASGAVHAGRRSSRIYSGRGGLIDEFAKERRLSPRGQYDPRH